MISVITPTTRQGGIELLEKSLGRQTFKAFEWLISSPNDIKSDMAINIQDPPKKTKYWPLNAVYNNLVKKSHGELLVSYQDFIAIPPDALEKLWFYYQQNKKSCVTAIGDIYTSLSPDIKVWEDPRRVSRVGSSFLACLPAEIEFNFCSIPRSAWLEVGGADESLDFMGYDPVNINVIDRISLLGYETFKDCSLEVKGIKHEAHPLDWDEKLTVFGVYGKRKEEYLAKGLKLCYM
jgi:hypothetical protein